MIVSGAPGPDTFTRTAANEVLFGNGGNDTFVFAEDFDKDTVADFHAGDDALQFSHRAFTDVADVLACVAQVGTDVTITIDAGHSVTLFNNTPAQLTSHDDYLI